ncbi:MAG TPA: putative ABC exporter domain-containing protein [Opitutales bacterium]|jgi:ABC-2 type transport system permease protein|nr:putative ABC exporter domain-containing protein [Opitutales bacterium]
MISALFFLQYHSVRNRLLARFKRMKQPKYLVGSIIGVLWMGFYFSTFLFPAGAGAGKDALVKISPEDLVSAGGALLLFFILLSWVFGWVFPNERPSLAFTEAEIAFLFPAPISRRSLIHYKLARSQLAILFSTLIFTLIRGRWFGNSHIWFFMLGWWLLLVIFSLHNIARSFAFTFLFERGLMTWWKRWLTLGAIATGIGAVVVLTWNHFPALPPDNASMAEGLNWVHNVFSTGVLPYVLFPFRMVVAPLFATDVMSLLKALGPALVILALLYFVVIRANVAFEEASIEYSQKIATRIAAMRERRAGGMVAPKKSRRDPFPLKSTGPAYYAILWKNLIQAGNVFTFRFWLILACFTPAMLIGASAIFSHNAPKGTFAAICGVAIGGALMLLAFSFLLGPALLRHDFRSDLPQVEIIKLYPMPGWQIVLGEILAPVAILAAVQWLLLLVVLIGLIVIPLGSGASKAWFVSLTVSAMLVAPALDALLLIIPNGVALMLPSWVRFDKNAPRGIETMGQNIILALGQLCALLVAMLPAGLIFALVYFLGGLALGSTVATMVAALAATAVLLAEAGYAINLLGKIFENFDLSSELTN